MGRAGRVLGLAAACAWALAGGTALADKPDGAVVTAAPRIDPSTAKDAPKPAVAPKDKQPPKDDPPDPAPAVPRFVTPAPVLPDMGTFDWMLFDLARPVDGKPRGLTTSSASVALSARSAMLAPQAKAGDVLILRGPALDATLGSVPAAPSVFGFLAPQRTDLDSVKLHEVGKLVLEPDGLLQRTSRHLLGTGTFREVVLDTVGTAVTTGLIARLGTARAQGLLGFDPSTHVKLFGNRLDQRIAFHCDPRFKNAGVDLSSQLHVLHLGESPLLRDGYLEGGVTVQRGLGPGLLPVRWGKLHLVNGHLDGGFGIYDPPTTPPVLTLDGVANLSRYRLHFSLGRENGTGHLSATSSLITQLGPLQTGFFFGGHDTSLGAPDRGFTTGVIAMTVF